MIRFADTEPPCLRSDGLGAAHGFFGRPGGVSVGFYESLNCGPGSKDDPASVAENRERCRRLLGADALYTAYQIHSAEAVFIDSADHPQPKADALVTKTPGLAIGILTADCMPVLFHDAEAGIIGAAHAGWRGALAGILEACVDLMAEHGAEPSRLKAVIGPSLRPPHFEVGDDLISAFTQKYPFSTRYFSLMENGRHQFDAPAFAAWRLYEKGLIAWNISDTRAGTLAHPDKYFSYRHSRHEGHADYGRNLSAIVL